MHYYRYRPYSELALKELLYSEMYFASPEECNDPFDSKSFFIFEKNPKLWSKVLQFSVFQTNALIPEPLLKKLVAHLCDQSPISFEVAANKNLLATFSDYTAQEKPLIEFITSRLADALDVYKPATRYFVSFSKSNSDPLMWAHYANKHSGFCLIFKDIDGFLYQSNSQKKRQIQRTTENWIAKDMSYKMPDRFEFIKIDYQQDVKPLNAFLHMPVFVTGQNQSEEEINQIRLQHESPYKQKSKDWEYEQEFRLILPPPLPWLFGKHFDYTKHERLFHYQSTQLVGLVYGAKLTKEQKLRIQEIITERKTWEMASLENDVIQFDFIEFDAKLSGNQRVIDVSPLGRLNHRHKATIDKDFNRLYNEWLEGWGWKKHDRGARKIKVE